MRNLTKAALIMSCLPLLLSGVALGGEGVEVKITNDGTEDIVVTVYDMNTTPRRLVLTNAHINGFTSVPITLIANADGKASLSWAATSADAAFPKCGHADTVVGDEASVNVHADSSCGA
jgi:hypothetical protein